MPAKNKTVVAVRTPQAILRDLVDLYQVALSGRGGEGVVRNVVYRPGNEAQDAMAKSLIVRLDEGMCGVDVLRYNIPDSRVVVISGAGLILEADLLPAGGVSGLRPWNGDFSIEDAEAVSVGLETVYQKHVAGVSSGNRKKAARGKKGIGLQDKIGPDARRLSSEYKKAIAALKAEMLAAGEVAGPSISARMR